MEIIHNNKGQITCFTPKIITRLQQKDDLENAANNLKAHNHLFWPIF